MTTVKLKISKPCLNFFLNMNIMFFPPSFFAPLFMTFSYYIYNLLYDIIADFGTIQYTKKKKKI